jgi:hypothetical protein
VKALYMADRISGSFIRGDAITARRISSQNDMRAPLGWTRQEGVRSGKAPPSSKMTILDLRLSVLSGMIMTPINVHSRFAGMHEARPFGGLSCF